MNISIPFAEYKRLKLNIGGYSESEFNAIEEQYKNICSKFKFITNLVDNDKLISRQLVSDLDLCIQKIEDTYIRQSLEWELITLNTLIHLERS